MKKIMMVLAITFNLIGTTTQAPAKVQANIGN